MDLTAIVAAVLRGYTLPARGPHGVAHWARVLETGLKLAEATGANPEVVALFAVCHDARRWNEDHDPGHGERGGLFARSLRGTLIHLPDHDFDLLFEACRLHTDGLTAGDVTLQTCWDADRLDLGRVGITPDPARLCTAAARTLRRWAHARAEGWHEPDRVTADWGVT